MHFVRVDYDVGLVRRVTETLRHLSRVGHTVSRENGHLHGDESAAVVDFVLRVLLKVRQIFKELLKLCDGLFLGHVLYQHGEIVVVASCARVDKITFVHGPHDV